MRFKSKWWNKFINDKSFLPSHLNIHMPIITIKGEEHIIIEQQYKLIAFAPDKVILQFKSGKIHINGNNFVMKMMFMNELTLQGTIHSIQFQP